MAVVIETTKGVFTVDLYIDQRPKCKLRIWLLVSSTIGHKS